MEHDFVLILKQDFALIVQQYPKFFLYLWSKVLH